MRESQPELRQWRCTNCGKLLAKIRILDGKIEIKCRCGTVNTTEKKPRK